MSKNEKANTESNIVAIIQAGAFLGSLAASWIAARIGHRWNLITVSVLVCVGVALQAAASGILPILYVGR